MKINKNGKAKKINSEKARGRKKSNEIEEDTK